MKEGVEEIYKLTGKKNSNKKVMILGGGKIAYNTAKKLSENKIRVSVIEINKEKAIQR